MCIICFPEQTYTPPQCMSGKGKRAQAKWKQNGSKMKRDATALRIALV